MSPNGGTTKKARRQSRGPNMPSHFPGLLHQRGRSRGIFILQVAEESCGATSVALLSASLAYCTQSFLEAIRIDESRQLQDQIQSRNRGEGERKRQPVHPIKNISGLTRRLHENSL